MVVEQLIRYDTSVNIKVSMDVSIGHGVDEGDNEEGGIDQGSSSGE